MQRAFGMSLLKKESEYNDLDKYQSSDGDIFYYKKDTHIYHNPYGPAIILSDGYIEYCIENTTHRLDGPAKIFENGEEFYYINDELLNKEEFEYHPERLKYLGKEHLICLK